MGKIMRKGFAGVHAALALLVLMFAVGATPVAMAQTGGDQARGARLYIQCRACHTIGAGERDGVGPNLNNVVGSRAASRGGFAYSPALKASGVTWNAASLDAFIARPTGFVPGSRMAFAGVASAQSRRDIIAYLAAQKPNAPARSRK
jgi:cytochrome c